MSISSSLGPWGFRPWVRRLVARTETHASGPTNQIMAWTGHAAKGASLSACTIQVVLGTISVRKKDGYRESDKKTA